MNIFLTSNPCITGTSIFNKSNKLVENLTSVLEKDLVITFIASNPNDHKFSLNYIKPYVESFINLGYNITKYTLLDNLNKNKTKDLINESNLVILCGGHCPTQNIFFKQIKLKDLLKSFTKTIIGISAGSMNSCKNVYAIPELSGEAIDKNYNRYLNGLNLTDITIIPDHKDIFIDSLDNLNIISDILLPDSIGKKFYIFKDGSYLFINDHSKTIYGLTYIISNKKIIKLIDNDEQINI